MPVTGGDCVDPVAQLGAQLHQAGPVAQQGPQLPHRRRSDPGLRSAFQPRRPRVATNHHRVQIIRPPMKPALASAALTSLIPAVI
jgi:hypothetical protein